MRILREFKSILMRSANCWDYKLKFFFFVIKQNNYGDGDEKDNNDKL
jgi:hypothetical protein